MSPNSEISAVIFDLFDTLITNYDRNHYLEAIDSMAAAAGTDPIEFCTLW
jgi:hypothetical protein